jgi:16S rRNA G966 N2-methylase RsmD
VTHGFGLTAVFLDPPYSDDANRANDLYAKDDLSVSHKVREWLLPTGITLKCALLYVDTTVSMQCQKVGRLLTGKQTGGMATKATCKEL